MELKEMIKVMQHYADGGEVEYKRKHTNNPSWIFACPVWDWINFDYRIKEPKQKVTIEKWLCRSEHGESVVIETSDIDTYSYYKKVKLLKAYEIEL